MKFKTILSLALGAIVFSACSSPRSKTAEEILGNPDYPAIAYGGYRNQDRSQAPSVADLKEDLQILHALGFRILRTYHARLYDHTPNLLQAISEMKQLDPSFEMYVMLGAWMQCEGAWGAEPNHFRGDSLENTAEIEQAVKLANQYPDIVKIIAVGNEAMVHWAASYFVHPRIILKEVKYLQSLKAEGKLPASLWITSSDNFASWGGGDTSYHVPALDSLIAAVDYLSVHSYPFHDTHYNPNWWWTPPAEDSLSKAERLKMAVARGVDRVQSQLSAVEAYQQSLGRTKPLHIGETGWASADNVLYGAEGSGAADEFKQRLYYQSIHDYCRAQGMACFYFEAFDEPWKDGDNPGGSENHFGLISVDGLVKAPLWADYDRGILKDLTRASKPLRKSLGGDDAQLIDLALLPPRRADQPALRDASLEGDSALLLWSNEKDRASFPVKQFLVINSWEGSCRMELDSLGNLVWKAGSGDWWGGGLNASESVDLSAFEEGYLELEVMGSPEAMFHLGWQSGLYEDGSQQSASWEIGAQTEYPLSAEEWQTYRIAVEKIKAETNLKDVRTPLYVKSQKPSLGLELKVRRALFKQD